MPRARRKGSEREIRLEENRAVSRQGAAEWPVVGQRLRLVEQSRTQNAIRWGKIHLVEYIVRARSNCQAVFPRSSRIQVNRRAAAAQPASLHAVAGLDGAVVIFRSCFKPRPNADHLACAH